MSRYRGQWLGFVALCVASIAALASNSDMIAELGGVPSSEALIEKVNTEVQASVEAALAGYDSIVEREPHDVALRVERCKFLDRYVASFEVASFLDRLYARAEECKEQLEADFPGHPEILLLNIESSYGEQRERQGSELLSTMLVEGWTHGQLGRLYAVLAQTAQFAGKSPEAEAHARAALSYDEKADVRLILAETLLARGEKQQVVELLTTPFDAYKHDESRYLLQKMKLLSRAGAKSEAGALYEKLSGIDYYNHLEAAGVLRDARAIELARMELQKAGAAYAESAEDEKQLFLLELEHGTGEAALEAYNAWRDAGWRQDPLGANRVALAMRDITLPWKARDLLSLSVALVALLLVVVACGAPVAAVHYWGFLRRYRSGASYPTEGWQLRHAWAALAAFGTMALLAIYAAGPFDINVHTMLQLDSDLTPRQWSRYALSEALLVILAMAVVLKLGPASEGTRPWSENWSLFKALCIGAALGIALRIPLMLVSLSQPDVLPLVSESELWQILRDVRDELGLVTALWLLGLMAPVVEELIFRRVLLDAFSSHLGFPRANIIQAALFAAIHMDARGFVFLFGIGLLLGYLARRSGGLVAPMIMHGVFNGIAGFILLR